MSSPFETAFSALNPQQQKAVNAINGPVLVIAGAGTGKTQVLALRIAKILEETDANPENILCLTFTESGVVAMKRRLASFLGTPGYRVAVSTFHSFCDQIIREHPDRFLFAKEMEMLDDLERAEIFREILKEIPLESPLKPFGNPLFYLSPFSRLLQTLKREGVSPRHFQQLVSEVSECLREGKERAEHFLSLRANVLTADDVAVLESAFEIPRNHLAEMFRIHIFKKDFSLQNPKNPFKPLKDEFKSLWESLQKYEEKWKSVGDQVFPKYAEKLKERGRYDYEDMILFVLQEFRTDPAFLATYQERFHYLLADEFQDTNSAQKELLDLLSGEDDPNVFVVGDDDQSIYRFQGASLENILDFFRKHEGNCEIIALQENYRSTQEVLDGAKAVIDNNEHRIFREFQLGEKRLISQKTGDYPKIEMLEFKTVEEEMVFLGEEVNEFLKKGIPPEEIAILVRDNTQGIEIFEFFKKMGIPARFKKSKSALENPQLLLFLRIFSFLHTESSEDLSSLLFAPFFHIPLVSIARFLRAIPRGSSAWEFLLSLSEEEKYPFAHENLFAFRNLLLQWKQEIHLHSFPDFFAHVLHTSHFYDWVLQEKNTEALSAINGIYREIKKWASREKHFALSHFLSKKEAHEIFGVPIPGGYEEGRENGISLLTMHGAKGLEFEVVFMAKCIARKSRPDSLPPLPNMLQNDFTLDAQMAHEDERRLFYVAMTRAKSTLILSLFQENGEGRPVSPIPFWHEIPDNLRTERDTSVYTEKASRLLPTFFLELPQKSAPDEEFQHFLQEIIASLRLSPTHLNTYRECPRKFLYSVLLRVPRAKNRFSALGTAAHEVLRKLYLSLPFSTQSLSLEQRENALRDFEHFLSQEMLSDEDFEAVLFEGKIMLNKYFDHYSSEFFRSPHVLLEYDFFAHSVEIDGVPVTGRIDKIEFLDEEKRLARITDYKTGSPENALKKDDAHRQIIFYALLSEYAPVKWKMVEGELDFLAAQKNGTFVRHTVVVKDEEKEEMKKELVRTWEELKSLSFLSFPESRMCGECEYCTGIHF